MQHRCNALKADYQPCTVHVALQGELCRTHTRIHARRVVQAGRDHEPGKCEAFLTNHRWCSRDALHGDRLCTLHARVRERQQAAEDLTRRATQRAIDARHRTPPPTWQQYLDEVLADETLPFQYRRLSALRYYGYNPTPGMHYDPHFFNQWCNWVIAGRIGLPPLEIPPVVLPDAVDQVPRAPRVVPELARIARDNQNVHTAPVTRQTNDSVEKLLAISVPDSQQTEKQMTLRWLAYSYPKSHHQFLRVAVDVNRWFTTKSCRTENDMLYRRVLRGLVAHIELQSRETRNELYRRLWEECLEATNMCCEGHISRLCNVLVGFDESFKPPVSLGELLQDKMSAIARLEATEEEKRKQALVIMEELGVPELERVAWLEAF